MTKYGGLGDKILKHGDAEAQSFFNRDEEERYGGEVF